jgi:PAS domain S-box-containing protein
MIAESSQLDTGMDLRDLLSDGAFKVRPKQRRDPGRSASAFRQLSQLLAKDEESVLHELVAAAVEFCGADSAGISLEEPENGTFRWVAIAGSFEQYLDGRTPRNYSPCGTCLDTGRPQLYSVTRPYYDFLGVSAEPITDGILIPWSNESLKGTVWVVSHSSSEAFDSDDYEFLKSVADFSSIILRHQERQRLLQEAESARATADTRFQRLMETEAVGIIFFNNEGIVVDANDVFLKMVDYTREDLASGIMSWRKLTPPEWIATSEQQMIQFAKTGRVGPYEKEYFHKDGSRRWMMFAGRDLGDGTIGEYAIDITDRKRAEAALVRNEKLASLGRLVSSISHEINNPLEATTNLLYLAKDVDGLPVAAKEYLLLADAELKRITHITRQSLGFYRESSSVTEVSVSEILDATIDLLQSKISNKNAHIERRWNADLTMQARPGELRQIFSNLLTNSIDAIDQDGRITIRANRYSWDRVPMVRVTFADSGCGIDRGKRSEIFDPFFTTKHDVGNGLGLWVTSQIVEKHRGSIRMRSRTEDPCRGTTFSVAFPI